MYYDPLNQPYLWSPSAPDSWGDRVCGFTQNAYQISLFGSVPLCIPEQNGKRLTLRNFVFEIQMRILVQEECGAVLFRADIGPESGGVAFIDGNPHGYMIQICEHGGYHLKRQGVDHFDSLVSGETDFNSVIRPGVGQTNTLAFVADQSTIEVFVNGHKLLHVSDRYFASGSLALTAAVSFDEYGGLVKPGPAVAYRNAKIWALG